MGGIGPKLGPVLLVVGVVLGTIIGVIVGAAVVSGHQTTTIVYRQYGPNSANLTSVNRVTVPVTNAVNTVKVANPAVVSIEHKLPNSVDQFGQVTSGGTAFGSGFVIDKRGDIVTNNHVITGGNPHYTITFESGKTAPAVLVGANPSYDVAVIRTTAQITQTVSWADSSYVEPGQPVIAIGDALGQFPNTVTSGIISGLHRSLTGTGHEDYIQTDAPINHGNSGGPLLNLAGQVLGINTAIQRSTGQGSSSIFGDPFQSSDPNSTVAEGLGFVIPSDTAAPIAQHLIHHTALPFLGVCYESVPVYQESKGVPAGARVQVGCGGAAVKAGSPAARAGIRPNDVIVKVGNLDLSNGLTLIQATLPQSPGSIAAVKLWRPASAHSDRGHYITRSVTFGKS